MVAVRVDPSSRRSGVSETYPAKQTTSIETGREVDRRAQRLEDPGRRETTERAVRPGLAERGHRGPRRSVRSSVPTEGLRPVRPPRDRRPAPGPEGAGDANLVPEGREEEVDSGD